MVTSHRAYNYTGTRTNPTPKCGHRYSSRCSVKTKREVDPFLRGGATKKIERSFEQKIKMAFPSVQQRTCVSYLHFLFWLPGLFQTFYILVWIGVGQVRVVCGVHL